MTSQRINLAEFIRVYAQCERRLIKRAKESEVEVQTRKNTIDTFKAELEVARTQEVLNTYGIMTDSKMTVQVVEAEDLRTTQSAGGSPIEPYVLLSLEGQQAET